MASSRASTHWERIARIGRCVCSISVHPGLKEVQTRFQNCSSSMQQETHKVLLFGRCYNNLCNWALFSERKEFNRCVKSDAFQQAKLHRGIAFCVSQLRVTSKPMTAMVMRISIKGWQRLFGSQRGTNHTVLSAYCKDMLLSCEKTFKTCCWKHPVSELSSRLCFGVAYTFGSSGENQLTKWTWPSFSSSNLQVRERTLFCRWTQSHEPDTLKVACSQRSVRKYPVKRKELQWNGGWSVFANKWCDSLFGQNWAKKLCKQNEPSWRGKATCLQTGINRHWECCCNLPVLQDSCCLWQLQQSHCSERLSARCSQWGGTFSPVQSDPGPCGRRGRNWTWVSLGFAASSESSLVLQTGGEAEEWEPWPHGASHLHPKKPRSTLFVNRLEEIICDDI